MNKAEVIKIIKEQAEPMNEAVARKLDRLQSDEVFNDKFLLNTKQEDNLLAAFNEVIRSNTVNDYSPDYNNKSSENTFNEPMPKQEGFPVPPQSGDAHKKNLAARLAALRGLSMPGDYITRK